MTSKDIFDAMTAVIDGMGLPRNELCDYKGISSSNDCKTLCKTHINSLCCNMEKGLTGFTKRLFVPEQSSSVM